MASRFNRPMVAAFDLLVCLLMVFTILAIVQKPVDEKSKPKIETLGMVAVKITWKDRSEDDVDLYVKDPNGRVCFFLAPENGLMHLEYDHLGASISGVEGDVVYSKSSERIIIRGAIPGEYVVNVHMYTKRDRGPQKVTVELWRLRGNDKLVTKRVITLKNDGEEQTAFRFTLDSEGNISKINYVPMKMTGEARSNYYYNNISTSSQTFTPT